MSKILKYCSLILCFCLVIGIINPTQLKVSADDIRYGYISGTNVNVRSGAGTNHSSVGKLSNTEVVILGTAQSNKGETWYHIRTYDTSITGYVHGDYVSIANTNHNILKGDTNGDYVINSLDVDNVNKHISGTQKLTGSAITCADTNSDGTVDSTDLANIQGHINGTVDLSLEAFPESYKSALKALKQTYPNYIFLADYIDLTFNEVVENQMLKHRKLVSMTDGKSWRALGPENYNWQTGAFNTYSGNWTDASREMIAHYVDPRNFLNINNVYAFVTQSYNEKQNADMLAKIIKGTFLENGFTDASAYECGDVNSDGMINTADLAAIRLHLLGIRTLSDSEKQRADVNGDKDINTADLAGVRLHLLELRTIPKVLEYEGSYINIIMEAARQSGVNPYVLASTIILEQGVNGTSALISGEHGCYNFFNYGASGSDVIGNGVAYAKSAGWTSRSASIIGGAKKYAEGYIAAGQNTYYYKDFDVQDTNPYTHQYAQSIYDAISSSARLRSAYIGQTTEAAVFRIPVYKDMPQTPVERPEKTDKLNNYYFTSISAAGLSPSFSMYNKNYSLSLSGNTTIYVSIPQGASYAGSTIFNVAAGVSNISLPVKSETGYINTYIINVNANTPCTITVLTP